MKGFRENIKIFNIRPRFLGFMFERKHSKLPKKPTYSGNEGTAKPSLTTGKLPA